MAATQYISNIIIPGAAKLLPPAFDTPQAHAMLLAIGLQESRFEYRVQVKGPAQGFWQFESGGGWKGVVNHAQTSAHIATVLKILAYGLPDLSDFYAVENNDILACVLARLLLWTHPKRLPLKGEHDYAWSYYIDTWRPGKPHRETWDTFYDVAWNMVEAA